MGICFSKNEKVTSGCCLSGPEVTTWILLGPFDLGSLIIPGPFFWKENSLEYRKWNESFIGIDHVWVCLTESHVPCLDCYCIYILDEV